MFVDSFKAFDAVDHQTNFTQYYDIAGNNLRWFEHYLKKQLKNQLISFKHNSTNKATLICGVHQRSILGPLLFLLYSNDLHHASEVINPIMLADDANLFFPFGDINVMFERMNEEQTIITNWFNTFIAKGFSQTSLVTHLSKHIFPSQ